jgi:hypothetical protein
MSGESEFSINLGGGLYMDSNGVLSRKNVPANKPTYSQGGGFDLPIKPETLEKALKEIKTVIPNKEDKEGIAKLVKLGLEPEFIEALQWIGEAAGKLAKFVPYISTALAVLDILGLFSKAQNPLDLLMKQIDERFDKLEQTQKFEAQRNRLLDIKKNRNRIDDVVSSVEDFLIQLSNGVFISYEEKLKKRNDYVKEINSINGVSTYVRDLLSDETYLIGFYSKDYKFWKFFQDQPQFSQPQLFTFPLNKAPKLAIMPGHGESVPYHRLMSLTASYAISKYLILLRAVTPEFRSTREFRGKIYDFAKQLEQLIITMRSDVLVRTVYSSEASISLSLYPYEVTFQNPSDFLEDSIPKIVEDCQRFPVGALDLRYHDDTFFKSNDTFFKSDPKDLLSFQWARTAHLKPNYRKLLDRDAQVLESYSITNWEECALGANAQAEEDYANLLYSSGYLALVHLLATLKQEATDPDRSQTVKGSTAIQRLAGDTVPMTVTNEIRFLGTISSPAEQQAQQNEATISFTTQPLDRDIPLQYRVCLRTLNGGESIGVENSTYGNYYRTSYIDDPEHPGFKKLAISLTQELEKFELVSGLTRSPAEVLQLRGTATMQAMTFDSWLPSHEQAEIGWENYENKDWGSLFKAARQDEIALDYALSWEADAMTITLKNNNPADRNYIVYAVVEEKLGSGLVLHTVQRIPITGQLTWVPQAFFDEEKAAIEQSQRRMAEIDAKAKQNQPVPGDLPRPGDPRWEQARLLELVQQVEPERLLEFVQQVDPERLLEFVQQVDPERLMEFVQQVKQEKLKSEHPNINIWIDLNDNQL